MSSSAPSSSPPSARPAVDLAYSIDDVVLDPHRDGQFLYRRLKQVMLHEGTLAGGRTLDVACGVGSLATAIAGRGGEAVGIEPSPEMLGLARWVHPEGNALFVRGVAETLPFRDAAFDRVICQGSLDHFIEPRAFMREAARVLRPDGRVVIALANYESLSCWLGGWLHRSVAPSGRPYWQIPDDHNHKGDIALVRALGARELRLDRCYGISLCWQLRRGGWSWGKWLDRRSQCFADIALAALDKIAYRAPVLADMIVSVWRRA
jgi:SAM-dependent methyltransferase